MRPADEKRASLPLFKTPLQAFRQGMDGYRSGNMKSSVEAFEYAAANGNPLARWKLGKMYAEGDGVPQDDYKAFKYFSQIVQNFDEDDGDRRDLSVVSNAFVAVGRLQPERHCQYRRQAGSGTRFRACSNMRR